MAKNQDGALDHHNGEHASDGEKARGSDHNEHPKANGAAASGEREEDVRTWTFTRIIAVAALCNIYVGSQMILYFVSAGLTYIKLDLKAMIGNWMLTANTLAVAAVCPFVGYLTNLLGRKWVCCFGTVCLITGSIVMATANALNGAVAAMAIAGIGAGICELTAVAG